MYASSHVAEHADHIQKLGGVDLQLLNHRDEASPFCRVLDAPVFCHAREKEAIEQKGAAVEFTYDSDHWSFDDDLCAYHTPGHATGVTSFLWESSDKVYRVLFTGDTLYADTKGRLASAPVTFHPYPGNRQDMITTLRQMIRLNPTHIISGLTQSGQFLNEFDSEQVERARPEVKSTLFSCLDQDGDRRLNRAEMKTFAELTGFEGTDEDWAGEFEVLCEAQGCDFTAFSRLIDDDSDDGLYCDDSELADMLNQLLMSGVGIPAGQAPPKTTLGEAVPAGIDYFIREREAGLYDGDWKPWDPNEGIKARTPRVGKIGSLDGCPSTADVQEALMFVNEQVQEGIFGDASSQAEARLGELLALQGSATKGAGWFEFRLDENVMDEEQLSRMVLAPSGWQVDRSTIPTGYMMHIMSVGNGVKATLCGREGLHIVNSLHRDVSKCKRLCDTGLCGVVGRKRARAAR
ncbi:retsat [Symbiodinium natans]|uniref:Retsat protein n=1 Tax=Symbiodinium natans TaxID=878477 RepID=A0A812T088_9DINO|nr:retsat [Symbiodinium natans]